MLREEYDYIIVGQGIAGTCLSHALEAKSQKILIIDDSKGKSASKIAGGLINPITGRNMVLTWKADELFATLTTFYRSLEKQLGSKFLHTIPLYRPFANVREQNRWQANRSNPKYSSFIHSIHDMSVEESYCRDTLGGLLLKNTGYLDTSLMIKSYADYLVAGKKLKDELFDLNLVNLESEIVVYKDYTARKVIFCEGPSGVANDYFKFVKFSLVKGEVLVIHPEKLPEWIISKGIFMIPKENCAIVGSTYDRTDISWQTTSAARQSIEENLNKLYTHSYKFIEQRAGIRPTVIDRRPVVGIHPNHSQIGIFNGLGAKGVTLAPHYALQFANHLVEGTPLDKEVNVERFF